MKKLLFINGVLAIAVLFTYCSKPDLKQELSTVNPETGAGDRGTCVLSSIGNALGTVTVCGTNTNATRCVGCLPTAGPTPPTGVVVSGPGGALNLTLTTPISFSITAPTGQTLLLNAGGNQLGPIVFPAGGCRSFFIDDNCNISLL